MDKASFDAGMDYLKLLPKSAEIDPREIRRKYADAFARDDGRLFVAACELGFNTAWKFFPTPVEIREQMQRLIDAAERIESGARYAALVGRSEEHHSALAKGRPCLNHDCGLCDHERRLPKPDAVADDPRTPVSRPEWAARPPTGDARRGGTPQSVGQILTIESLRRRLAERNGGGVA